MALVVSATAQPQSLRSTTKPDADHLLYSGVDIYVSDEGSLLPVTSMGTKTVIIENEDGEKRSVDANQGFIWKIKAKVSSVSAQISELDSQPTFSLENDPLRRAFAAQVAMTDFLGAGSAGEQLVTEAPARAISSGIAANSLPAPGTPRFGGPPASSEPGGRFRPDLETVQVDGMDYGFFEGQVQKDLESGAHDGVEVSFEIKPSTELADVHAMVLVKLMRDDEPEILNFIRHVGHVPSAGREVKLSQTGIRPGFKLVETDIFIFNHDHEIPTNLSERSMPLTAADAWEFARLNHQTEHRLGSSEPRVLWSLAPDALREATDAQLFDWPITLELDERGVVQRVDDDGRVLPPLVRNIVSGLPCLPAVEKGQPVPSRLRVNLADYFPPQADSI